MDLLQDVPSEVWEKGFDILDISTDLLAAYNTCKLWKSLLTRKRTEWMFQGAFPSLFKYLPKQDILNCRGVCKRWNKVVDSYLESDQYYVTAAGCPYQLNRFHPPLRHFTVDMNLSASKQNKSVTEALESFQAQFSSSVDDNNVKIVKNPFVARSLELTINELNVTVLKFFEKYGTHLWSLRLTINLSNQGPIVPQLFLFEFIWSILSLAPNLKKLILITQHNQATFLCEEEKKAQAAAVKKFLKTTAVPFLPYLNNLHMSGDTCLIRKVLESTYAPQLNKFVYSTLHGYKLKNLTKLTELTWYGCPSGPLGKLRKLKCPALERLQIVILGHTFGVNVPKERWYEELKTFKNSLKYLSIYWDWFEPTFPSQLDLPFVEEISLQIGNFTDFSNASFCFLKTLTSLRKLKFTLWNSVHLETYEFVERMNKKRRRLMEERVDLKYYLHLRTSGGLYDSNVWRLVPSLETIEVCNADWLSVKRETKIYTRFGMDRRAPLLSS